jgi:hypothetical protein
LKNRIINKNRKLVVTKSKRLKDFKQMINPPLFNLRAGEICTYTGKKSQEDVKSSRHAFISLKVKR